MPSSTFDKSLSTDILLVTALGMTQVIAELEIPGVLGIGKLCGGEREDGAHSGARCCLETGLGGRGFCHLGQHAVDECVAPPREF